MPLPGLNLREFRPLRPLVAAALLAIAIMADGKAQPPPQPGPAAGGTVERESPDLYYLQDDAGRLVPVPGFRYRDFIDLMRLKDGLPGQPEPPGVVLETVTLSATLPVPTTDAVVARSCAASLKLSVRQVRSGWVSVPIDLQGFLVAGPPVHDGPGDMFFTTAGDAGEAVARLWFNAVPEAGGARHTVTLEGAVAVESSLGSDVLSVVVPPATASRVELRTPRIAPEVTVRPPSLPPLVEPLEADRAAGADEASAAEQPAGSLVTIVGAAGPLHVRVADRRAGAQPINAVPEATVESVVRVDGKSAAIEATLRLDGLPPDVSSVRITLPARTSLRGIRQPAALIERTGTAESPVAVVRIERDSAGVAIVEMQCEGTVDAAGKAPFDPLGFAVAGVPAWRQRGRVSLIVDGDWQLEWADAGGNRRIDAPASARRPGFVAAFAYDSQPASLPMRVRSRGSRLVVEPDYRYEVGATRITLDGRLRVSVRGAAISRLAVELAGWELDDVGPLGLIDSSAVALDDGRLVIPFQQGLAGDAVIDFRCSRAIDRSADRVAWAFPMPEASLVGPASVLITSASDIELVPDAGGLRGLVRMVAPAPLRSDVDRLALVYRLDGGEGQFQAQRRFLDRRVDAAVRTQIDIQETVTYVTETVRFTVAHVPLEFAELRVPPTVVRDGGLEIRQGGQLLNPVVESAEPLNEGDSSGEPRASEGAADDVSARAAADAATLGLDQATDSGRWSIVRAMLPVPLLGTGEVIVSYRVPTPEVPPETTVPMNLPIAVPVAAAVGRQTLQVASIEPFTVDLRGEDWKRDAAAPGAGPSRSWTTARFQDRAPLAVAARRRDTAAEVLVEAAWMRTRILSDRREDVATFAVGTAADRIAVALPATAAAPGTTLEVRVDGRRIDVAAPVAGRLTVPLPEGGRSRVLLEIRIGRSHDTATVLRLAGLERISIDPPDLAEATQRGRFYWELDVPSDQHVIVPPLRWSAQQRWQWTALGLERRPFVSRAALVAWVRDNAELAGDDEDASLETGFVGSRALFSGVGAPGNDVVWTATTWLLVLAASGPVLAVGLLLVYLPTARTVPVAVGIGLVLTAVAAASPQLAPLLLQAAAPGAALAALAAAIRGLLGTGGATAATTVFPPGMNGRGPASPSIIITPSAVRPHENLTTPGRSAS